MRYSRIALVLLGLSLLAPAAAARRLQLQSAPQRDMLRAWRGANLASLAISRAPRIFRNPRTAIFQKADSATNACKRNIEMTPLHRDDTPPQDRGDTPPVQPGPSVDRRAARMKSKPCFFDIRLPLMLIPLKAHSYRL